MQTSSNEVILAFLAATAILLFLVGFIILFAILFQRRQLRFRREKEALRLAFEQEIQNAQTETQEQTLQYVGQELHDNIGQLLTVVTYQLNGLEDDLAETQYQPYLHQSTDLLAEIIQAVRQLSKSLDHQNVHRFGLLESIAQELNRIQRIGKITTTIQTSGEPYTLNDQVLTMLFRMAQESLNNALKHAKCQQITVSFSYGEASFGLTITDDGQGFSIAEAENRPIEKGGSGLRNMAHRAELLGGIYQINSQPGAGTTVSIQLPISKTI
jgi:signal transduction histidine kinase